MGEKGTVLLNNRTVPFYFQNNKHGISVITTESPGGEGMRFGVSLKGRRLLINEILILRKFFYTLLSIGPGQ